MSCARSARSRSPRRPIPTAKFPSGRPPTGKIQFVSEACEAAGLSACPVWVEPQVMPNETVGEFRLIGGKQAIHTYADRQLRAF